MGATLVDSGSGMSSVAAAAIGVLLLGWSGAFGLEASSPGSTAAVPDSRPAVYTPVQQNWRYSGTVQGCPQWMTLWLASAGYEAHQVGHPLPAYNSCPFEPIQSPITSWASLCMPDKRLPGGCPKRITYSVARLLQV